MEAKAKPKPNQPRPVAPINNTLEKHLATYMTLAVATGVGMLALAQPSEGEIVYTATNQSLFSRNGVTVDFNNDGVTDLTFRNFSRAYATFLAAYASGQNHFMSASYPSNSVLPWGKRIGPNARFGANYVGLTGAGHHFGTCVSYRGGNWFNKRGYYLGVQFSIGSDIHYGWVRLTITGVCTTGKELITGYAYETIPNKPIIAGKTSGFAAADTHAHYLPPAPSQQPSLGMLALGAEGLNICRREEEEA